MRSLSAATRVTLLSRVRDGSDVGAWEQFHLQYRDLLVRFCRSRGLQVADAEDVIQLVFTKLAVGLRTFEYDPSRGRFRDYLYRCVRNAIADHASRPKCAQMPVVNGDSIEFGAGDTESASAWEREWLDHHFRRAIAHVRETCEHKSIEVFEAALGGKSVRETALVFGMTEAAVYKVLQRVRDRLRERIAEQVRDEDVLEG